MLMLMLGEINIVDLDVHGHLNALKQRAKMILKSNLGLMIKQTNKHSRHRFY
jgi:hypothetical protein